VRSSVLAATAALSLLPAAVYAQSSGSTGFGAAVGTQLRDAPLQSAPGAPAVISGPVGGAPAAVSAGTPETLRVWGKSFGFESHVGGDANGPAYATKGIGAALGAEKLVLPNFLIGAAFGYTAADTGSAIQDVRASTLSGSLYGSYALGALEFDGAAGINGNRYEASRRIAVGGTPLRFDGTTHGLGWSLYGDAGYRFQLPTALGSGYVKPLVAVSYSSLARDASTETATGGLALDYRAQTFDRLTSLLGVDFGATHALAGGFVRPEFRVGWIHEYTDPSPAVFASLGGLPGSPVPIVTRDPNPGRDGLALGAQATMWSRASTQFFVGYNGEFRSNLESHQGTVGFRAFW
jgi:outer membrane autotransporter protein